MAMIYDVKEFATAVKPLLLKTLRTRGASEAVVYFDPDIEIFAPLDDIAELAREHSIVLTPHMMTPLPPDGLLPDDLMILRAGVYNLGFIAVGPHSRPFLDWWSEKLARDCLVDIDHDQFVDQRWIDLVPVLFEHTVVRNTSCNVAYWNLHERSLRWTGEHYEVDDKPLRFFHFSGFDPKRPDVLSTHVAARPRIRLPKYPHLSQLCRDYSHRLIENGYFHHADLPYRFDTLPGGVPVDHRTRGIYRTALRRAELRRRTEPPDPFGQESAEAFLDWLKQSVGSSGLSRYLHALYLETPAADATFPLVSRLHRDRFLQWVATVGRYEAKIPPEFLPCIPLARSTRARSKLTRAGVSVEDRLRVAAARHPLLVRAAPAYLAIRRVARSLRLSSRRDIPHSTRRLRLEIAHDPAPGINAAGYLSAELGIGEVARKLVAGIERAGIPFSTITLGDTVSRQQSRFEERAPQSAPYDTNLVCINADSLPTFARTVGPNFFLGRYTIGVWFWELELFPDHFSGAFDLVDEVWVGSGFVRDSLTSMTTKPVSVVPIPLEASVAQAIQRSSLGLPESFLFYFTFDFLSIFDRKNPLGLVEAFKRAFSPSDDVALLVKSINGDRSTLDLECLHAAAAAHPSIYVMDGYLAPETKDGLMASCDCYVSLHRSEGLGLTMAEAMLHGKPVIATGYSGNLAFMDSENSYLVPHTFTDVPAGCFPYPAGARWAEPELDRAAVLMRHVYENQNEAHERGLRAQRDIATHHTLDRTADFIASRLEVIHGGRQLDANRQSSA